MSSSSNGDGFAGELARMGRLPRDLLERHMRGEDGRCVVCSNQEQTGPHHWPCSIRSLATHALVIQARLQTQKSPEGVIWLEKGYGPERLDRTDQ